ncbi:MAG: protein-disulfide reductase DsbD [Chlorobiaceae bacterium]
MIHLLFRRAAGIFSLLLLFILSAGSVSATEFLDPDQAFRLHAELGNDRTVRLHWKIAKGYKLYRDKVRVSVEKGEAKLRMPLLPKGVVVTDPSTNEKLEIYHDGLSVSVPVVKGQGAFTLKVEYQGCAEDGLCYAPITKSIKLDLSARSAPPPATLSAPVPPQPEAATAAPSVASKAPPAAESDLNIAKAALEGGSLWKISLAFLAFGLLLSFTPCVLPMIPILSSIIVGEGDVTRRRSFLLAVIYCLGMALVYTSLGVAAGLAGEGLAGALQKPWVLVMFSLLLVGLSLSMFDLYQLQMPASLQSRLSKVSGNQKGGSFVGVFVMGALSALIVGPCVAAPLAGTLVYISQTRDVLIGALALFSMAAGMSVPLLLVGLSAGSLLPRAGAWMIGVKYVFGLLLIAVAIWMVSPVLPPPAVLLAWGFFAMLSAVFLGVFDRTAEKLTIAARFAKAFGLALLAFGILELVGAASGGSNPLEPISGLHSLPSGAKADEKEVGFRRIKSVEELDKALQSATKPVMLDFYADWCVSCKEMDKFTFHDSRVMGQLSNLTLLQVDVSANTDADRALMKRFGLFGPPGIVFFDKSGKEIAGSRIVGFVEARAFFDHLSKYVKIP